MGRLNSEARHPAVSPRLAYVMLVMVTLLWASGVIVARSVHTLVPPIGFSFWRWAVAVLVLTPFAWRALLREWHFIRARKRYFLLLGMFMAGGSTLLVWSVQYTSATNVALISAAQPIVTTLMAWVVLKDRVTRLQLLGIAAAAGGITLMVARMDMTVLLDLRLNPGDVLILLAVVFYACYAVNLHRWYGGLPPLLMMYLTALGGLVVLLPFYVVESVNVRSFEASGAAILACIYMALIPTLAATTMWNISVGVIGPSRASVFLNLLPIFGTLLAVIFLGEQLHVHHLVGGVLVCIGITLVVRRRAPAQTP